MGIKCVPKRTGKKPGPKSVGVEKHKRSKPQKLPKVCGR